MPFIALDVTDSNNPLRRSIFDSRLLHKGAIYECQSCRHPMHIRRPSDRAAHFAHNPNPPSGCAYHGKGESEMHLEAKRAIALWLPRFGDTLPTGVDYSSAEILFEYPVLNRTRIIDVAVLVDGKLAEIHEAQFYRMSDDAIAARMMDYRDASEDIKVHWWVGGNGPDTQLDVYDCYGHNVMLPILCFRGNLWPSDLPALVWLAEGAGIADRLEIETIPLNGGAPSRVAVASLVPAAPPPTTEFYDFTTEPGIF